MLKQKYHKIVLVIYLYFCLDISLTINSFWLKYNTANLHLGYSIVTALVSLPILALVCISIGHKIKQKRIKISKWLLLIAYAALFAIPEEYIFRGLVLENFGSHMGSPIALLSSSAIFGMAHLFNGAKSLKLKHWNWNFALVTFVAGIFLGHIYLVTGSLIIPTIVHAIYIIAYKAFVSEKQP